MLRALASDRIFAETEPGVFRDTAASDPEVLARDGWDDFAHLFGDAWLQAVTALDASGEPSFPRIHGSEFWAWLAAHPDERAAFDRAMAQGWQSRLDRLESVDSRDDELVVDVGGGNGSLLVALLERHREWVASCSTSPRRCATTRRSGIAVGSWRGASLSRCRTATRISSRQSSMTGTTTLARRILETVRAGASGRLIVLDSMIEPGNGPDGAKWLDLLMPALAGGRERTAEQWRAMLEETGWRATRVDRGMIEA